MGHSTFLAQQMLFCEQALAQVPRCRRACARPPTLTAPCCRQAPIGCFCRAGFQTAGPHRLWPTCPSRQVRMNHSNRRLCRGLVWAWNCVSKFVARCLLAHSETDVLSCVSPVPTPQIPKSSPVGIRDEEDMGLHRCVFHTVCLRDRRRKQLRLEKN